MANMSTDTNTAIGKFSLNVRNFYLSIFHCALNASSQLTSIIPYFSA